VPVVWLWLRLALVALAAYVVASISLLQAPMYQASAQMLVGWDQRTLEYRGEPPIQEIMYTIESRRVAQETIQRLGLETNPTELLNSLSTDQVEGTQFIKLTYEDTNPHTAKRIANTVGQVSSELISEHLTGSARFPDGELTTSVWKKAGLPAIPASPQPWRNAALTLVLGVVLAVVLPQGTLRPLAARSAQIAGGLAEHSKVRAGQLLIRVRQGVAQAQALLGRRAALSEAEAIKEKKLLRALDRCGRLTALGAAWQTGLSVEEAERILSELADKGHLEVSVEGGSLVYSFWEYGA
jgi:capsular polysaccharide biosynthesis protein